MPLNQAALYPENWAEILSLTWYTFLHQTIAERYFLCKYLYLYSTTEPKQRLFQAEILAFLKLMNCSILRQVCSVYWDMSIQHLEAFVWFCATHSSRIFSVCLGLGFFEHLSHKIATEVVLVLDAFRTKKVPFSHVH